MSSKNLSKGDNMTPIWDPVCLIWVAVKELKLAYHSPKTILFAMYP